MHYLHDLLNFILHLDTYIVSFMDLHGTWTYLLVFAVIFCETGLIVTPFLPGDALLFAVGSIAALSGSPINILTLLPLLTLASILGNQLNYLIGRAIGPRVFSIDRPWIFNQKYLLEAHQFYEKHGGKTLILARFIPIIRTFVPFIAGVSYMSVNRFSSYNVIGAILWIFGLVGMGYFLGSIPMVKNNFSMVIYGIIAISILPLLLTYLYHLIIKPRCTG